MQSDPQRHEEPVTVFDTPEESEALVVQGLLSSAGIEASIIPLDAAQNVFPGVGGVQIAVSPERAEEAKRMIAEQRGAASATRSGEDAASEEPAA